MDSIKINTTQNVELEYAPAGLGYRILGAILDRVFLTVYVLIVILLTGILSSLGDIMRGDEPSEGLIVTLILILLPAFLYHLLCETFMNGQSLGKKIVGIQVVRLDGTQPTFGAYFLRWILRIVDVDLFNGMVAVITVAVTDKSQRLGDIAAGTTVILKHGRKVSLQDTILYREVQGYKIAYPQVALLSDKDIGIIKEVMDYCLQSGKYDSLILLATKTQTKMGVHSPLSAEHFLKTVLLDYSHYQFEK